MKTERIKPGCKKTLTFIDSNHFSSSEKSWIVDSGAIAAILPANCLSRNNVGF